VVSLIVSNFLHFEFPAGGGVGVDIHIDVGVSTGESPSHPPHSFI